MMRDACSNWLNRGCISSFFSLCVGRLLSLVVGLWVISSSCASAHGRHRSGRRKRLQRVSGVMDLRWTVPLLSQTAAVHQDTCSGSMKRLETRICEKWFVCQMLGVRCAAFETVESTPTGNRTRIKGLGNLRSIHLTMGAFRRIPLHRHGVQR